MRIDTGITKRGDSFLFTVYLGYRPDGKQIRKTRTWKPPAGTTEKKAIKMAKAAYIDFQRECKGAPELRENMRFSELVDWYFENYAPNRLKPQTTRIYRGVVNHDLLPAFGNKKLCDFTSAGLTQFFRQYSAPTAKRLNAIMRSIFSCAVQQGFIKDSPFKNVILPKDNREKERRYMTKEETALFLQLTEGTNQINAILRILLFTGMRIGECLGLTWDDIDFQSRSIHIRHTLTLDGLSTPKTKHSARTIAMSETVFQLLSEQSRRQMKLRSVLGNDFKRPEMVFTSRTGNYKADRAVRRELDALTAGTPLEFLTPHILRHSNATLLLNAGVDIKIISEHLGHNDIGTTANIYADVLSDTRQTTAEIVEKTLSKQQISNNSNISPLKRVK